MQTASINQLNNILKTLPENLLQDVMQYVEFLSFKTKSVETDWANSLTPDQLTSIEKGRKDIEVGRVISHKEAKERIKQYIQNKTK